MPAVSIAATVAASGQLIRVEDFKATVGADLLSDLVRIRGTLANPQTEIDPVGVARTTVFRGIDAATFGLTALAKGLASKISADQVCEEALRKRTPTTTEKGKRK